MNESEGKHNRIRQEFGKKNRNPSSYLASPSLKFNQQLLIMLKSERLISTLELVKIFAVKYSINESTFQIDKARRQ